MEGSANGGGLSAVPDSEGNGPERSEEPKASRDGEGRSIAEMAAAEDAEEAGYAPPPPLPGDKQLTLGGLGKKGVPIESEVSLMSASVPIAGLVDPEKEGRVIVSYKPLKYEYVPVREGDRVVRWKLRQHLRPVHVMTPEQQEEWDEAVRAEHREDALV